MDFNSIESIKAHGFLGFKTISEVFDNKSEIPRVKGVYLILYVGSKPPQFLEVGSGPLLYKKKVSPNVSFKELQSNWVNDTIVINIGKAGGLNQKGVESKETLRSRLSTYFSFGQGRDVCHYGGRLIWQLANSESLIVCWRPTPVSEPREMECNLIKEFKRIYGRRPFANLRD